jgi:hypothetical protein
MRIKNSRTHKKCLNNFFWPKIFITNILCANVYKMYECDKNQMPYCNVKSLNKWNLLEFWAIDRTWPTLDKFYYSHFHKFKRKNFRSFYKIWSKIISFDMKKKVKCKTCHGKKKRWIWKSLEWILKTQMWHPDHAWTLMYKGYL